jgi:hypothetical protein
MDGLELGRWDWLLLSITLGTLGALLHWVMIQTTRRSQTRWAATLASVVQSPWVIQPLRLTYGVGLPAAMLFWQRALTTRGMGLKPLPTFSVETVVPAWAGAQWSDWVRDLGWGALVVSATCLLVLYGDRVARQGAAPQKRARHDLWLSLREGIYHQVHWAFYREPFVVLRGLAAGSWLGALPVALEALLSPLLWEGMRGKETHYARSVVLRCGIYAATTLVFLQTQNLWMAIAADTVLGWVLLPLPAIDASPALALPCPDEHDYAAS